MKNKQKARDRNSEIVTFFYAVFGHRVHRGIPADEARKESYDAVRLRYGIGKGRLLNIISDKRCSQSANETAFRANALALIDELNMMNESLDETKDRNTRLISLLKECIENDR